MLRSHASRLVAIAAVLGCYWLTRLPRLSGNERAELAQSFAFEHFALPELDQREARSGRQVHPGLERISWWISSVGGAVALTDLDGDGLANDLCYVDTRLDKVVVAPVPGTGERFPVFALNPAPLPYDRTMAPMGCVPGDLNEDGLTDVLAYFWGRPPIAFLRKDEGNEMPSENGFLALEIADGNERWNTNALTRADVDGDGHTDLVIGNYFPDGDRVLDPEARNTARMQDSMSRAFNGGRARVLLWRGGSAAPNPSVRYEEIPDIFDEEVALGWTLALAAADLDGDMLPELYFGNDFGPDRLLHNRSLPGQPRFVLLRGKKGFTTPNSKVLGRDSFKGMGVDFGDLDGDGRLDIYVSNIAAEYGLEESHFAFVATGPAEWMRSGIAPFTDRSESLGLSRSGWGWESRLGDFNNDGVLEAVQATGFIRGEKNRWPELHELAMGNDDLLRRPWSWPRFQPGDDLCGRQHNPFFVLAGDGRFYDLAAELGIDAPQVTRGIATADVDGDGDLDFAVGNQWETSRFYRNTGPNGGRFLGLHLRLPVAGTEPQPSRVRPGHPMGRDSRPAIGARADLTMPDGSLRSSQVDGGNGHTGVRAPHIVFGLGDLPASHSLSVYVHWRDAMGRVRQERFQLNPGWHTILLDGPAAASPPPASP